MPVEDVLGWARDYRLDVDPDVPKTPLGALASHVAWEHRMASVGEHAARESLVDLATCPLTAYLRGRDDRENAPRHEKVHSLALSRMGSVEHRAAWEELAALVSAA